MDEIQDRQASRTLESQAGLKRVLDEVESVTVTLVKLALFTVGSTTASVLCLVLIGVVAQLVPTFGVKVTMTIGLVFSCIAIFNLIIFNFIKNRGDTLFKEASDELQWYVRYGDRETEGSPYHDGPPLERPEIRTRIVLREYAKATVLPFLSSSGVGIPVYIATNVALLISYPVLVRIILK